MAPRAYHFPVSCAPGTRWRIQDAGRRYLGPTGEREVAKHVIEGAIIAAGNVDHAPARRGRGQDRSDPDPGRLPALVVKAQARDGVPSLGLDRSGVVRVAWGDRLPGVPAGIGGRNPERGHQPRLAVAAVIGQRLARPLARDQYPAARVAEMFAAVGLALAAAWPQAPVGILRLDAVAQPVRAGGRARLVSERGGEPVRMFALGIGGRIGREFPENNVSAFRRVQVLLPDGTYPRKARSGQKSAGTTRSGRHARKQPPALTPNGTGRTSPLSRSKPQSARASRPLSSRSSPPAPGREVHPRSDQHCMARRRRRRRLTLRTRSGSHEMIRGSRYAFPCLKRAGWG